MNWTEVPVYRGITEISPLLDMIEGREDTFILGGYVRYCCSPRRNPHAAQDVDLFFESQEAYDEVYRLLHGEGFRQRADNDAAVTLKYEREEDGDRYDRAWDLHPTIQLVKPQERGAMVTEGSMEDILENFDFTVVRLGLLPGSATALADERFQEDEEKHFLFLRNIHCPVSSTLRAIKYGRKGYWMNTRQTLKLFRDWDSRTDEYRGRIIELIEKEHDDLSREEIEELEALLRID